MAWNISYFIVRNHFEEIIGDCGRPCNLCRYLVLVDHFAVSTRIRLETCRLGQPADSKMVSFPPKKISSRYGKGVFHSNQNSQDHTYDVDLPTYFTLENLPYRTYLPFGVQSGEVKTNVIIYGCFRIVERNNLKNSMGRQGVGRFLHELQWILMICIQ